MAPVNLDGERGHHAVQSIQRAFRLLEGLADTGGEASISELAGATGLPMPTIHRLLGTLAGLGYVRQNLNRRYALGSRLIRLGEFAGKSFGAWARPFLYQLVEKVGETANLAVLEHDEVVYVAQVTSSKHQMRLFTEVGNRVLPHSAGVGKAMLSQMPPDEVRDLLLRTGMPAYTPNTYTNPDKLITHLADIARRGYAIDENEHEIGVRCVAAPLKGSPVPAAVSVSGPDGRLTRELAQRVAPIVVDMAQRLSKRLAEHELNNHRDLRR